MQSKIFSQSVILNQVLWLGYESGTISGINIFNNRQRKALENKQKTNYNALKAKGFKFPDTLRFDVYMLKNIFFQMCIESALF